MRAIGSRVGCLVLLMKVWGYTFTWWRHPHILMSSMTSSAQNGVLHEVLCTYWYQQWRHLHIMASSLASSAHSKSCMEYNTHTDDPSLWNLETADSWFHFNSVRIWFRREQWAVFTALALFASILLYIFPFYSDLLQMFNDCYMILYLYTYLYFIMKVNIQTVKRPIPIQIQWDISYYIGGK